MKSDAYEYCKSCLECAKAKAPQRKIREPLKPIQPMGKLERIVTDVMGPLPTTARSNRYILIFMDHFTIWIEAIAMPVITAEKVAKLLVERIICRHGAPQVILSEKRRLFYSRPAQTGLPRLWYP